MIEDHSDEDHKQGDAQNFIIQIKGIDMMDTKMKNKLDKTVRELKINQLDDINK